MRLKVISFNIRCCDDVDGNSIIERSPRLYKVIEPYEADVIGIQEYTPLWESEIERLFGQNYEIFNKYRTSSGWIESAPILWKKDRFECVKKGYFWLSDTPEVESAGWDEMKHNRICIYAILSDKQSGESFVFMNTHLGFGNECQKKSVALICDYAKKISSLPTFITGDFNMTPDSEAYTDITKEMKDANALTVNDMRSTFHGYAPKQHINMHIDYCFIDSKTTAIDSKIIDELVDGKFPSDHYGLYTELEI